MNGYQFLRQKHCKKDPQQRNVAANMLKRTFCSIFLPPYLKAAIASHGLFSKTWSFSKSIFKIMKDIYVIFLLPWIISPSKENLLSGFERVKTIFGCKSTIMYFQNLIFKDFAYLISPYQISKNERNLDFKLSPPLPLLQKLPLKRLYFLKNRPTHFHTTSTSVIRLVK